MSLISHVMVTLTAVMVAAHQGAPRAPLTQSVDLLVPFAPVTFNQAGSTQLVYELHVTNFLTADVSLTGVRITDVDGRTLAEYRDAELRRRIVRPGLGRTHATPQVLGSGARAVVNFWIALPAVPRPSSIRHALELEVLRPTGAVRSVVEDARSPVSSPTAVALGPPLRGGPWVAIYDPLLMGGHRTAIYTVDGRARIPGRFAIDFVAVPPGGALVRNPAVRPDNWNGFGSDVLAVADGTVAAAVDDTPDDTPKPVAPEYASGNYVAIDLGDGALCVLRTPPARQRGRGDGTASSPWRGHCEARVVGQYVDWAASPLSRRERELIARRRGPAVRLQRLRAVRWIHFD